MSGGLRFLLLVTLCWLGGEMGLGAATGPRFNEIQVMGTHNSYHIAPEPAMMQLIEQGGRAQLQVVGKLSWTTGIGFG